MKINKLNRSRHQNKWPLFHMEIQFPIITQTLRNKKKKALNIHESHHHNPRSPPHNQTKLQSESTKQTDKLPNWSTNRDQQTAETIKTPNAEKKTKDQWAHLKFLDDSSLGWPGEANEGVDRVKRGTRHLMGALQTRLPAWDRRCSLGIQRAYTGR